MLEIEKIREKISQLDEEEAKSLLMIIYSRLDTVANGNSRDEFIKNTIIELVSIYKELPDKKELEK